MRRMTAETQALLLRGLSEREFQAQVVLEAERLGWLVFHAWNSRHSQSGYPDLTLVHPQQRRVVFAEIKRDVASRLSARQSIWLSALRCCPGVESFVWKPSDLGTIRGLLTRQSP
jgi:hypothetical protein